MAKGEFAASLRKFAEKAKGNADLVVRKVTMDVANSVLMRSPVGKPELWAANSHAAYGRANHNLWVDEVNRQIDADPSNFTKSGNLKRGVKRVRRVGQKKLKKLYRLQSGKGYMGGRFRANWQFANGAPASGVIDAVDPSGKETKARLEAGIEATGAGGVTFISNNLPYGHRLEYEGWSKQQPAGMVGVTMAEFQDYLRKAVSEL